MRFTKMYCNVFIKNVRSLINSYLFQLCYSLNLQAGIHSLFELTRQQNSKVS